MPARFEASKHGLNLGLGSVHKAGKARMASMSPIQQTKHQKTAANIRWQLQGKQNHVQTNSSNG